MKVREFLKEKIGNFKIFITEELNKISISDVQKEALVSSLDKYSSDLNNFTQHILLLVKFESIDIAVKHFLLSYEINIDDIIDKIDYNKLKKYLEMFIDLVKK